MADAVESGTDIQALRWAMGKFATGVTVIATREEDGTPRGFTANSFTSVSLNPPLILVCIAYSADSCDVFCNASHFSVSVLGGDQKEISNLFATQRDDKFENVKWHEAKSGMPLISGALAWFDCGQYNTVEAGDHVILIGRVENFSARDGQPLGYFSGNYFDLEVEQKLVDAIASNTGAVIGAIYQKGDTILLCEDSETGALTIPEIGRDGEAVSLQKIESLYSGEPLSGSIEFVYSVFEDKQSNDVIIYYRGHASGDAPPGHRYVPLGEIPWERIEYEPVKTMLRRFKEEYSENRFAIYMGDEIEGIVRPLK